VTAIETLFPGHICWSFLVGVDTMARILDPEFYGEPEQEIAELFRVARFVIYDRSGEWEAVRLQIRAWLHRGAGILETRLPETVRDVSSSQVRRKRALGLTLGSALRPTVAAFIQDTGLYSPEPSAASRYEERKRWLEVLAKKAGNRP
jgi:nicotinic acid mononucleotide adenylyltransferase